MTSKKRSEIEFLLSRLECERDTLTDQNPSWNRDMQLKALCGRIESLQIQLVRSF